MPSTPALLENSFSDTQLKRILDQATLYACACPAQVCKALLEQRALFAYQANCLDTTLTDRVVHRRIAEAVRMTHPQLESCLHDVLALEGWDMKTLTMPEALQKRLLADILGA